MKKILSIFLAIIMFVPLFANASWWNPISWFTFFFHPQTQVIEKIVYLPATSTPSIATQTATVTSTVSSSISKKQNESATSLQAQNNQAQIKLDAENAAKVAAQQAAAEATASNAAQNQTQSVSSVRSVNASIASQETASDLLSKMNILKENVENIISQLNPSDVHMANLQSIDSQIKSYIYNFGMINLPTSQNINDYLNQYNNLESYFESFPPMIFYISNGSITADTVITGYGFTNVTSVYILPPNPSRSDSEINLPILSSNSGTIDIKLTNTTIPAGEYNLYAVTSSGQTSAPFPTSVNQTITAQQEQQMSTTNNDSVACQTAQQSLKVATQDSLVNLEQSYLTQVQFYCQ